MINRHIVKALVDVALFLETSNEKAIDPDCAVAAMEQMAANLQALDAESKRTLANGMLSLASDYSPNEHLLLALPETLGIAEE